MMVWSNTCYLVGGFKHLLFSIINGIIFPIDFHIFTIFCKLFKTTNQNRILLNPVGRNYLSDGSLTEWFFLPVDGFWIKGLEAIAATKFLKWTLLKPEFQHRDICNWCRYMERSRRFSNPQIGGWLQNYNT